MPRSEHGFVSKEHASLAKGYQCRRSKAWSMLELTPVCLDYFTLSASPTGTGNSNVKNLYFAPISDMGNY